MEAWPVPKALLGEAYQHLGQSFSTDTFGEWKQPRDVLGFASEVLREGLLKEVAEDRAIELRLERDKTMELSKLLQMLASDARAMKTQSTATIKQLDIKVAELEEVSYNKDCRVQELHLDLDILNTKLHESMEENIKKSTVIAELRESLSSAQHQTDMLQREFEVYKSKTQEQLSTLRSDNDAVRGQLDAVSHELAATVRARDSCFADLRFSRQRCGAIMMHYAAKVIKRRLLSSALCVWRSQAASESSQARAQLHFAKERRALAEEFAASLAVLQSDRDQEIQRLRESHEVAWESERRKHTRVADSRNLIIFDLLRNKRVHAIEVLSMWKSAHISRLREALQDARHDATRIAGLNEELRKEKTDAQHKYAAFVIGSNLSSGLHRELKAGFDTWAASTVREQDFIEEKELVPSASTGRRAKAARSSVFGDHFINHGTVYIGGEDVLPRTADGSLLETSALREEINEVRQQLLEMRATLSSSDQAPENPPGVALPLATQEALEEDNEGHDAEDYEENIQYDEEFDELEVEEDEDL